VHHLNPEGQARLGVFFATSRWYGEPYNAEPDKCGGLTWAPIDDLPANTVPYTVAGVELYRKGVAIGCRPDLSRSSLANRKHQASSSGRGRGRQRACISIAVQ